MVTNMQINSPLQMNDWEIRKLLTAVLAIQLAVWGMIGLDVMGVQILALRQVICFIYLTFIPGALILRTLRLHRLGSIETLSYSVGLSLAALMFTGLFMNTVYPFFGISRPISPTPLIITISLVVLALCVLSYIRDKDFSEPSFVDVRDILSPPALSLCLIPFLSILGTYLVNFHQNNVIMMLLIVIIAMIVVLIAFDRFIPKSLYPLAVFVIAVSLLYHTSLISSHISGWDIQLEYYFSKLVLTGGYWNSGLYGSINGMLAIVMLAPMYSTVCNLDLVWVFKTVYPVLFSFVPLAMYRIFQRQADEKMAFFACFFFMSMGVFYSTMLQLARQQIAELFLVLILFLVTDRKLRRGHKSLLLIVFGASLVVSHYGTAYLFMFILIAYYLFSGLINHIQPILRIHTQSTSLLHDNSTIGLTFVIIFTVVTLTWYMYTAGSSPFKTLVHTVQIISAEFVNPSQSDAFLMAMRRTASPLHEVTKILYYITQLFIALGVLNLIVLRKYAQKLDSRYALFSIIFFGVWVASVLFPYYGFDFTRVYHITLIVLSLCCVLGGLVLADIFKRLSGDRVKATASATMKMLSILLFVYLLFNSGWVYEIAKDNPSSIALSSVDYPCFNEQEVAGAEWLHASRAEGRIYADAYRWLLLIGFEGYPYGWYWHYSTQSPPEFIFLGTFNIRNSTVLEAHEVGPRVSVTEYVDISDALKGMSRIYDNGGAQIYH